MKRRIAIILLLLTGGAIVNVAVAWGFCTHSALKQVDPDGGGTLNVDRLYRYLPEDAQKLQRTSRDFTFRDDDPRIFTVETSQGLKRTRWTAQYSYVQEFSINESVGWSRRVAGPVMMFDEFRAGWPSLSMRSMQMHSPGTTPLRFHEIHLANGLSALGVPSDARLPLQAIWPGFLFNTILYAAACGLFIWMLLVAPLRIRRALRRKRGLCEKCAYPIGVSPVCTECGAAVTPSPSERGSG